MPVKQLNSINNLMIQVSIHVVCSRVASCGHFTCETLQHYLFVCTDMDHHVHNVTSLDDLPGREEISTFV